MFTSRAEYRLNLRHDSADLRLFQRAADLGLHTQEAVERFQRKRESLEEIQELLRRRKVRTEEAPILGEKHAGKTFRHALKDPELTIGLLAEAEAALGAYDPAYLRQAALDVKYEGYIARQERQVERFRQLEELRIPPDFDYRCIEGISVESREKLARIRPFSVGQASRISGVRSADIAVLLVHLR
jgi:tRNA uridine 5-carboxymethylaminomethyl modification enzyme